MLVCETESDTGNEPGRRIAYVPALDGLRALAVTAVLAYHADFAWAKGGFLGVDAFFVLSGYLITTLLLAEWRDSQRIGLAAFWGRRARRLLPALFLMLGGVVVYAVAFAEAHQLDNIRRDTLSTLFYVANWNEVFSDTSYFTQFELPSPLRHAWSLAIEEQFYVVWPLFVLFVLRTFRDPRRALAGATLVLILASAALMTILYDPNADPSRIYYGTDTRAHSLLVGALLAMGLFWYPQLAGLARRSGAHLAAIAAAVGVGVVWFLVPDDSSALYYGGYLLFALAVACVVAVAVHSERSLLAKALGIAPLRALGLISYGVYLWHWPVYLILSPERTGLDSAALMTVRVTFTLAISIASYAIVEMPVRRGALARVRVSWLLAPFAVASLVVGVVMVTRDSDHPYAVPDAEAATLTSLLEDESAPRVMLIGDSIAHSLATGLYGMQAETGFAFLDASAGGCGIMPASERHESRPYCAAERNRWRPLLETFRPHVVAVLISPFDGLSRQVAQGDTEDLVQEWERDFREALEDAIEKLSEGGARIVLLTVPYVRSGIIDTAGDVDHLNRVAGIVALENSDRASVVDLNDFLSVDDAYSADIDGMRVRSQDNVHFTEEGARFTSAWLVPQLMQTARLVDATVVGSFASSGSNLLLGTDASMPDAWRPWRSTIERTNEGTLVSSSEANYGAFLAIEVTEMDLVPGQTYTATLWFRASARSPGGRIEVALREDGSREGESTEQYQLAGIDRSDVWKPIVVEHTITKPGVASLSLHLTRLRQAGGNETFWLREPELRLTSPEPAGVAGRQ